jgi:hypothetical protein
MIILKNLYSANKEDKHYFAVVRILGKDMNPTSIMTMMSVLQQSNIDLELKLLIMKSAMLQSFARTSFTSFFWPLLNKINPKILTIKIASGQTIPVSRTSILPAQR